MPDIVVKPASSLAEKYSSRAANATPEFLSGVANSPKDQAALAVAQRSNMFAALADTKTQDRWARNLLKAGTAKFKAKVALVGDSRYRSGIAAAKELWAANIQPFFDTLGSLSLGKKMPKGDPSNSGRSTQVQQALHAKKIAG